MEKSYNHLKPEERATVMLMMREGATVRSVARTLCRAPSTISRELKKNCPDGRVYEVAAAGTAPVKNDMRGVDGPSLALTPCCLALWNTFSVNVDLRSKLLAHSGIATQTNRRSGCPARRSTMPCMLCLRVRSERSCWAA